MYFPARASMDSTTSTVVNSWSSQVSPDCRCLDIQLTQPGPTLTSGDELAEAAKQGLGADMQFEDISE
jgi:hypothetical protein